MFKIYFQGLVYELSEVFFFINRLQCFNERLIERVERKNLDKNAAWGGGCEFQA